MTAARRYLNVLRLGSTFSRQVVAVMMLSGAAGMLNFLSNLLAARVLGPENYSDYGTFLALLSMLLIPTALLTTRAAQLSGPFAAHPHQLLRLRQISLTAGGFLSVSGALVMFGIYQDVYHISTPWWVVVFTGVVLLFSPLEAFYVGILQGQKRFVVSQWGRFLNAFFKGVGFTLLIVYRGNLHAALAIILCSLTFSIAYILGKISGSRRIKQLIAPKSRTLAKRRESGGWVVVFAVTLSSVLFFNLDMLVARAVFSPYTAGLFSAVTVIGKILVLGTGPISYVLYPHLLNTASQRDRRRLVLLSSALTVGIAGAFLIILALASQLLTDVLFGLSYATIAPTLVFYGIAFTFYSLTNVAFTVFMALHKAGILWGDVIGAAILETAVLLLFHNSLMVFVLALMGCMGLQFLVITVQTLRIILPLGLRDRGLAS